MLSLYWGLSAVRRYLPLVTLAFAVICLYCYKLDGVGVLGPDEPRYAAVGRAMARTGDLVTPRLWGEPWFEKPPLLYWLTAIGTRAGLNADLAGRIPVVMVSLCFLGAYFALLCREFGLDVAGIATMLLATSASWLTYSSLCLTDLPLAVFFSLAVLLTVPLLGEPRPGTRVNARLAAAGVAIGLAMLAKGLVPLALLVPFVWFLRRLWRRWLIPIAAATLVAAPWYVAVYARNGYPFVEDFFLKQHFERLYSPVLQHVQPWYYYVPVLMAGLFPWTPLLALLGAPARWDERRRFLAAVVVWGIVFFSISLNKLPGYLLPLVPSLFALVASHYEAKSPATLSRLWLLPCALLIAAIPLVAQALPQALAAGHLSALSFAGVSRTETFYIALPLATLLFARHSWAGLLLALCVVAAGIYLKTVDDPVLDRTVCARQLWQELKPNQNEICDDWLPRDWAYGLAYYRGSPFPACASSHYKLRVRSAGHGPPVLEPMP
ncbi:MAG: glycosyltransferase family 39 protein [Acidobacteriaceae bacterium]|nr:glycosyltransferase family 39 protein [Acidobacteriaceae bacterium]